MDFSDDYHPWVSANWETTRQADLVSVIITCYNGAKYLAEAIESVLAQTYDQVEIILIDDGSTDNSAAIAAQYHQVRYIYQANQGTAGARNRGIHASQGEYLVLLDQDDRLLPAALVTGVSALKTHRQCAFTFGQACVIKADGSLSFYESQAMAKGQASTYDYQTLLLGRGNIPTPSTVMFRSTVFAQVGDFNPAFGLAEDYEMYLKVARQFPVYCHSSIIVEYRLHGNNTSHRRLVQLQEDVFKVLTAQQVYTQTNPDDAVACQQGKLYWQKAFTFTMLRVATGLLIQCRWAEALQLLRVVMKSPFLFRSVIAYPRWLLKQAIVRLFTRPTTSTQEYLKIAARVA